MWFYYVFQFLVLILVPLIKLALKALSIGTVSYIGINYLMDFGFDYIQNNLLSAPVNIQQILGMAKIDVCINIMLSAVTTRAVLAGLNKVGSMKKWETFKA